MIVENVTTVCHLFCIENSKSNFVTRSERECNVFFHLFSVKPQGKQVVEMTRSKKDSKYINNVTD